WVQSVQVVQAVQTPTSFLPRSRGRMKKGVKQVLRDKRLRCCGRPGRGRRHRSSLNGNAAGAPGHRDLFLRQQARLDERRQPANVSRLERRHESGDRSVSPRRSKNLLWEARQNRRRWSCRLSTRETRVTAGSRWALAPLCRTSCFFQNRRLKLLCGRS